MTKGPHIVACLIPVKPWLLRTCLENTDQSDLRELKLLKTKLLASLMLIPIEKLIHVLRFKLKTNNILIHSDML